MERISFQRIDRCSLMSVPRKSLTSVEQETQACNADNQFYECA